MFAAVKDQGSGRVITKDRTLARNLTAPGVALALLCVTLVSGCGPSEKRVPVTPVSGKVSFNGEAPVGATILLHSSSSDERDYVPTATVAQDGTFKVTTYDEADGAPVGEYVATITWPKVTAEGARGPNVLPKKYEKKETSPIKLSVKDGGNQIPPIEIAP